MPAIGGAVIIAVTLLAFLALGASGGPAPGSADSPRAIARSSYGSGNPTYGSRNPTAPSLVASASSGAPSDPNGTPVDPTATPVPSSTLAPSQGTASRFGLGLLIADRGNGRLLIVNDAGKILWRFPTTGSLPAGQQFSADDAFLSPDGRTIVANDEFHEVIDRIDIVSRKIVWQYGTYNSAGSAAGHLHTPDDAYPLANGDVTVADIRNCRVLEINKAKNIVRQWGHTRVCGHNPPFSYNNPNGDTPLHDGGILITEIGGSRIVRIDAAGGVKFDIHVPVAYPSDAQPDGQGNIIVVDYAPRGSVIRVSPKGTLLWRYKPKGSSGQLDHPSLAIALPDGTIALNDDFRHRVVIIDPKTNRIVWQYGHTDVPGTAPGYLNTPDGLDLIPLGTLLH